MKDNRLMIRFAVLASLILLTTCVSQESINSETLIFPFIRKIYSYHPQDKELLELEKGSYQFSRYYYQGNQNVWLSSKNVSSEKKELLSYVLKTKKINMIKSGYYLEIIPLEKYVIFLVNSYTPKSGFPYEIYKYQGSKLEAKPLLKGHIDCIISDILSIDDKIIISGSDGDDTVNSVYLVNMNTEQKQIKTIFTTPKNKDFIKLLKSPKNLVCYLSQQKWSETADHSIWHTPLEFLETNGTTRWKTYNKPIDEYSGLFSFFGKGFEKDDFLFIPAINRENECSLFILNLSREDSPITLFPLPTGLYSRINNDSLLNNEDFCFIAYNYYQDQNLFRFLHFLYDSGNNELTIIKNAVLDL
ncbi:MAG: hypothetical protein JXR70_12300 [Spirochaetales bacterium]|nr:hypothetical protein [Spirochaetales bacterium]